MFNVFFILANRIVAVCNDGSSQNNKRSYDTNIKEMQSESRNVINASTFKTVFFSVVVSVSVTTALLYVPLAMDQAQLRNQVIMLQNQINSGCIGTGIAMQTKGYQSNDNLNKTSEDFVYQSSTQYYKVEPVTIVMDAETWKSNKRWKSEPFYAFEKGYLMYMSVYLNGVRDGRDSHVSVYLHLMKGPYDDDLQQSGYWPLRGKFIVEIPDLNYSDNYKRIIVQNYIRCELCTGRVTYGDEASSGWGDAKFLSRDIFQQNYMRPVSFQISYSSHSEVDTKMILKEKSHYMMTLFICYMLNVLIMHLFSVAQSVIFKFDFDE